MSVISSVPWTLLVPAATLVTLAFTAGADGPPAPATSSAYTWTTLHRHSGEMRGPSGSGVLLFDIEQHGNTMIATAFNQSFRSADAGVTWKEIPHLQGAFDVAFGDSGLVLVGRRGEVSRSVDDGETWTDVKTDAEGIFWSVVVAGDTVFSIANGAVLRSVDRGQTWRRTPTADISFTDIDAAGRNVIAVGGAGFVVTSGDGGETWRERWLPGYETLNGVAFADERTAVIVGSDGAILRSTDAGQSWTQVESPAQTHLRAVAFADPNEGLAVGFWGEAISTHDGGATWTRERSGTHLHLAGVAPRPGGGFLVSGMRELVLAVIRGGTQ